ncbi:MAG: ABC transporter permease [Christensenellales bacterium]|jgi:peptide/nickel transport system permease protein
MQTIKTMFRSPRFVVGFCMVLTITLYALFVPVAFPGDPKASRAESPFYAEAKLLIDALKAEDAETASLEIERLREMADANTDAILKDAVANVYDTIAAVETELAADPFAGAIAALEQVKSNRKYPLVNAEREPMKDLLAAGDREGAVAEGEAVLAHCKAVYELIDAITENGADFDAIALLVAEANLSAAETKDLLPAIENKDEAALQSALTALRSQHEKLAEYVAEAISRCEVSVYANAAAAAQKTIQMTYLIPKNTAPNNLFWFGTDNFSRDLFLEMAYGARTSLLVGLIAGVLATLIGITLGLVAGFVGGIVDSIITVITNTFIVIPGTIILILISIAIGQFREAWITGVIIGLISWPWTARAVRAQTTSLRYRDHVNMARITGYSTGRIILTEIMPYLASYIVMAFILQVAGGIGQEATLAMLGLGDPTGISLGRLMNWAMAYEAINFNRWWLFIPVACSIMMITFGLYLMNSGMDQVFNPKIRS